MGRQNEVKDQFASILQAALVDKFGGLPSNSVIAREFNLRAYDSEPVTHESVRRWIKGISMPDERKMRILVSWLALDLRKCFQVPQPGDQRLNGANHNGLNHHTNGTGNGYGHGPSTSPNPGLRKDQIRILQLIDSLPNGDKRLVEQLAKKLSIRVRKQV